MRARSRRAETGRGQGQASLHSAEREPSPRGGRGVGASRQPTDNAKRARDCPGLRMARQSSYIQCNGRRGIGLRRKSRHTRIVSRARAFALGGNSSHRLTIHTPLDTHEMNEKYEMHETHEINEAHRGNARSAPPRPQRHLPAGEDVMARKWKRLSPAESVSPCRIEGYAFRPPAPASNIS